MDQYGAVPFEQQQFGKAGIEGVKECLLRNVFHICCQHFLKI